MTFLIYIKLHLKRGESMQYTHWAIVAIIIGMGIYLLIHWKKLIPSVRRLLMGVILGLSVFYMVPVTTVNLNNMTKVNFCLQCHSMTPYGQSLKVNNDEVLAAVHYQNNYVPHEKACFTCHTDYSMFGPIKSKLNGLRHLYVHYTGQTPKTIKLYSPYNSANCLTCHQGKNFVSVSRHTAEGNLPKILAGTMSCTTTGCHDIAHVKDFNGVEFAKPEELPGGQK